MDAFRVLSAGARFRSRPAQFMGRSAAAAEGGSSGSSSSSAPTPAGAAAAAVAANPGAAFFAASATHAGKHKGTGKKDKKRRKRSHSASSVASEDPAPAADRSSKRSRKDTPADSTDDNGSSAVTEPYELKGKARLQAAVELRKQHHISVKGSDAPAPVASFAALSHLGLPATLLERLAAAHFAKPTPIQMQGIPVMAAGRGILGIAPTGSGKTLAFSIPVIAALGKPAASGFRACIVSPTRELANQIAREIKLLAGPLQVRLLDKSTASRNSFGPDSSQRFDILVSTPMRMVHALQAGWLSLAHVQWLVIDEADRLFENGFEHQIDEIMAACSGNPKIALFSATMPERVEELARTVLHDPITVHIGARNAATETIDQELLFVGREDGKLLAIRQLIQKGISPPVLIFVQEKQRAIDLFKELVYEDVNVDMIHADRSKLQRDTVVKKFRAGEVWVLIATDLMARGIDFKGVNMVINYDFPPSAVEYIHRVGRTGRAGRTGKAITFFTLRDRPMLRKIANVIKASGCDVPDWMLELKKPSKKKRARIIPRAAVGAPSGMTKDSGQSKQGGGRKKAAAGAAAGGKKKKK